MVLVLDAVEVASPFAWRWLLSDEETGAPLADHQVRLDPAAEEVAAFRDLYQYAGWRAVPDRRVSDQMKIVLAAGLAAYTFLEIGGNAATPMWVTLALFSLHHFAELQTDHRAELARARTPA